MSIGSIGGTSSVHSMFGGAKSGPGQEDGLPIGSQPATTLGDSEPTTAPQTVLHPETNIELHGSPTPRIEARVHLHPTPLIEPRQVFHYDGESEESQSTSQAHAAHHAVEGLPKLPIEAKPNRPLSTYDRHARDRVMVKPRTMIDLFV